LYIQRILPAVARAFLRGRTDAYRYLSLSISGFCDPEELSNAMRRCGLGEIAVRSLTCGVVRVHVGVKPKEDRP
jgi:demethylmenaquinone methyltransferase/2-methoxy-6-polyprenyl-1,4-benzoquinol methylase